MKILFITDNFPPEVNAPASRTYEHCRRWINRGANVTVITCAPNFPQGVVYEGYRNRLYQRELSDGIEVVRVWSYMAANEGFLKRILDYLSFAFTAFWAGLFEKCDIIVATSPQFFTTFTGFALSKIRRRPWVFELRDLWPESIVTVGALNDNVAVRLLFRIERFMYRQADLIVPVTDAFKEKLIERGIPGGKMVVVTNGVDPVKFAPRPKNDALLRELGLSGKFVIGYVGTHGMAHGLRFIVESLAKLDLPNVHLVFVGDGADKKFVVERAKEMQLSNVTFLDPVPKSQIAAHLAALDAALIPLRKSETFRTVIPSKIFESAAMEKPILLGVDGQARQIVEEHNAGLFFEPENEAAFITAIRKLASDQTLYAELQEGCRKLAKSYDRANLADKMLDTLQSYVGAKSG